jgi:hypothetical protein
MTESVRHHAPRDPLVHLSLNIFCDPPPDGLTVEQLYALHEFFHEVLAAGYKLYQVVPADKAATVIKQKFGQMAGALPPPDKG